MRRSRPKPLTPEERQQATEFKASMAWEPCAVCGVRGRPPSAHMEAHHVVEKQELKRRKLPPYDCRNALPLCGDCHERHTNASRRVPFRKLRPDNIAYAYEVLGEYASDYLKRKYPMGEEQVT